jgi:MOSC domain-containing protein YiiM
LFLQSGRSGIYFSVLQEGIVSVGDSIERIREDENRITVAEINRALANGSDHVDLMRRAVRLEALPAGIRDHFLDQLCSADNAG